MTKKRFFLLLLVGISSCFLQASSKKSTKIPVLFTSNSFDPIVFAEIDGKKYFLLFDIGMSNKLSLENLILRQRNVDLLDKVNVTYDFKGNIYNSPTYIIPNIRVGPIFLQTCEAVEENLDFYTNTGLWTNSRTIKRLYHGRIGRKFFENSCVLVDFPNSAIFIEKNMEELKKNGTIDIENFYQVHFFINKGVVYITIQTELGQHNVVFDTGASFSILNQKIVAPEQIMRTSSGKAYFSSKKLQINGCDFLDWDFAVTQISDSVGTDGFIGVDFFLEHAVCFDFQNNIAYIQKPGNFFITQWQRCKYHLTQIYLKYFTGFLNEEDL